MILSTVFHVDMFLIILVFCAVFFWSCVLCAQNNQFLWIFYGVGSLPVL